MKTFIALLAIGILGTYFVMSGTSSSEVKTAPGKRTLKYTEVSEKTLNQIKASVSAAKNEAPVVRTKNSTEVQGKTNFATGIENLFSYLKSRQVLYRYELNNSLKSYLDRTDNISSDEVDTFNRKINEVLEYHKKNISRLNFSAAIKDDAKAIIETLKNPLSIKILTASNSVDIQKRNDLVKIEKLLNDLTISKEVYLHTPEAVTPKSPIVPVVAIWTVLSLVAFMFLRKKSVITTGTEEVINPTFIRIMSDLDYPLIMVDQGLNIVWQNKKSLTTAIELSVLQEIFKVDASTEGEVKLGGKYYSVGISELAYKSGRKNFLAQLKPKLASNRHLEHLIDYAHVSSYIESHNPDLAFGDVNQSVAQLSVKLGYLFKVSGKFLDINFNKDISDCFIESDRLEGMMKEFIMGCHHIIKDESEVPGIYLRTNESGNKFSVSCFLMNFRNDALESHPLTRDFLRRFSILEAKYAICNPAIEFRFKETPEIRGLDITLNFENRSELESVINDMSATA